MTYVIWLRFRILSLKFSQILIGFVSGQKAKVEGEANAYISASLFEGLGMPIVEAMYFELPLIYLIFLSSMR